MLNMTAAFEDDVVEPQGPDLSKVHPELGVSGLIGQEYCFPNVTLL